MLRECPFCEDDVNIHTDEADDHAWVSCPECGCVGPLGDSLDDAERLWNTRGSDSDIG